MNARCELPSQDGSSGTRFDSQLFKNALHMLLDGPDAQPEDNSNFGVALALTYPYQHLCLAPRKSDGFKIGRADRFFFVFQNQQLLAGT